MLNKHNKSHYVYINVIIIIIMLDMKNYVNVMKFPQIDEADLEVL